MDEPITYGRRRSIVRRIGSVLPLKPPPKVYVSVTPLHSMTNSMIDPNTQDFSSSNGLTIGSNGLSQNKPDLLEPINFGSEVRLLALEQELQDLREQISTIVKTGKQSASQPCLSNGHDSVRPPPPPPPLPPPTTPHIARRASLQDHMNDDRKKPPLNSQKSMGDILKDMNKVKLKPVAKSPNGGPLRVKRENSPCNDLQEILRRRYLTIAHSPDSRNSSMLDDSF
ncbi:mitochondrial fission regulator 1 [Copidosoma floridanum]|uniref:mitochondrial fission regulator 1 n=1 Tax=Copidosoma floridanum TaxID=29053 RepID=UPI0006C9889D|nr:mitochondrial fission regulator 1 [Copidosoma floridanum]